MTEPFRPDDDLVSAVLDGEAGAEERARVAADPVLRARLAEFDAVRAMVAEPVAGVAGAARERAIATAVAEARRGDDVIVPLAARRDPRRFLAVAAGVLLVLLAAGFLAARVSEDGSGPGDSALRDTATDDAGSDESADSAGGGATSEGAVEAPFADLTDLDLGPVADEAELRAALDRRVALPATPATTLPATGPPATDGAEAATPVPGDGTDCLVRLEEADPTLDGLLLRATATYAGTPAVVHVFAVSDGGQRVIVVSADACTVLTAFGR